MRHRTRRSSTDRILAAAERVFAREGYGETSLRRLIAAARISTTAFYARFDSKESVLDALVGRMLGEMHATATAELASTRGVDEAIDRGVEILAATLTPRRALVRLCLTEAAASELVSPTLRDAYQQLADLLSSMLEGVASRGAMRVDDAPAQAWALVGALQIQVARWAVFDQLDDEELPPALRASARAVLPRASSRAAGKRRT